MSIAEAQSRIDEIDTTLASGVTSQSIGDRSHSIDPKSLRKERARLMRIVASASTSSFRRVVMKNG